MANGVTPRTRWRVARVVDSTPETSSARTIGLIVPGWAGHLAGQHVDVKLTAEDGYSAQRSYSLGRPTDGERVELTVQVVADGEVSPYLVGMGPAEAVELRGPIGGWFVWRPEEQSQVLLIAGGSGIVPLMAMIRQRKLVGSTDFRLIYSVRSPADVYYAKELEQLDRECGWLHVEVIYTREATAETIRPPGRVDVDDLEAAGWTPDDDVRIYVCGPTGFVESVTTKLIGLGHPPSTIRTERFGPSG